MNYLKTTAAAFMVCLCFSASAQQQSTTYRVNLFVPAKNNAKVPDLAEITQATSALESLLGKRGRVTKQIGLLPSPLPAIPGSVSYKTIALGPQRVQILVCSDAYADLSIQSDTSGGAFGGSGEKHSGCVYPSAAGIRASYVVKRYTRALGGVAGALFGGIRNSIQGDDSEWGNKLVTNAISHFKTNMPEALIESIEGPGTNAISTNASKVKELLTAAEAARMPVAAPVVQQVAINAVVATSPQTDTIEARKNLTAMGLVYHSIEMFHGAINRKDHVAVELYVKAGGVDKLAVGAGGKSAIELAAQTQDVRIIEFVGK